MDEMTVLSAFRSEMPPPEPVTLEATRNQLLDLLASAAPSNVVMFEPVARRRSLRRSLVLAAAGSAVAAAVAAVLVTGGGGGARSGPSAGNSLQALPHGVTSEVVTVAKVVNLAMTAAQHEQQILPGQYLQVSVAGTTPGDTWVPADRSGTWLWRDTFVSGKSGKLIDVYFSGRSGTTSEQLYPQRMSLDEMRGHAEASIPQYPDMIRCPAVLTQYDHIGCAALPTEPRALLQALYNLQVPSRVHAGFMNRDQFAFAQIASILDTGLAPTELRVGLYQALLLIPGVKVTAPSLNTDGHTGIAVGMVTQSSQWGVHQDLIFDKADGNFLGDRIVSLGTSKSGPAIKAGTVLESTSVKTKIVDKLPTVPTPVR
jgi:hypothetical protein